MVLSWKNLFADFFFLLSFSASLPVFFSCIILLHRIASGRYFYLGVLLAFALYMHLYTVRLTLISSQDSDTKTSIITP